MYNPRAKRIRIIQYVCLLIRTQIHVVDSLDPFNLIPLIRCQVLCVSIQSVLTRHGKR